LSAVLIFASSKHFSEQRHTANEQPAEARITYRYHPRFGEVVQIRRRLESGGIEFVVVLQPDGSFACLPAWMTEPASRLVSRSAMSRTFHSISCARCVPRSTYS